MTKTFTISEFMEYTNKKDNKQLQKDLLIFSIINIAIVGSMELLLTVEKSVEAVQWF